MATPEQMQILITAQTQDAVNDIQRLAKQLDGVSTKSIPQVGNAMGGMGKKAGQAGIQIQQLVGQVQGGVNPMVALSQQAADLGFVLGVPLLGAVAGIAASMAGPLLSAVFNTQEGFSKLAKQIQDVSESYADLSKAEREYLALQTNLQIANTEKLLKGVDQQIQNLTQSLAVAELGESLYGSFAEDTADVDDRLVELRATQAFYRRELEDLRKELGYINQPMSQLTKEAEKQTQAFMNAVNKTRFDNIVKAYEERIKGEEAAAKAAEARSKRAQEAALKENEAYEKIADRGLKSMEDGLIGVLNGTKSVSDGFKSMASSIVNDLIRMQIQQNITGPLSGVLSGALGGLFGGGGSFTNTHTTGSMAGAGRATGGPVSAGSTYLVGERGPELFTAPAGGGTITRNSQMGGGGVVQNINITTGVQQTVRAEILNLMPQISEAAKVAVLESRQRGGGYSKGLAGI